MHSKRALYAAFIKSAEYDSLPQDAGIASALVGAGVSGKGYVDLDAALSKLQDVDSEFENLAKAKEYGPIAGKKLHGGVPAHFSINQAQNAADLYAHRMREVAQQKILGVNAGTIIHHTRNVKDYGIDYAWNRFKQRFHPFARYRALAKNTADNLGTDWLSRKEHYDLFTDPKLNYKNLRGHMLALGMETQMGGPNAVANNLAPDVRNILFGTSEDTYLQRLKKLTKHKDYYNIRAAVYTALAGRGGDWNPASSGLSERILGSINTPRYTQMYRHGAERLARYAKPAFGAGFVGLGALGSTLLARRLMEKKSFFQRDEPLEPNMGLYAGGAGVGIGAATMPGAYSQYMDTVRNPNYNLGITFGTAPEIGAGHKEPANAIKALVQQRIAQTSDPNSWLHKIKMIDVVRDPNDILPATIPKLNTLVNTGGGYMGFNAPSYERTIWKAPLETQSMINYLTDLPSDNRPTAMSKLRAGATFGDRAPGADHTLMTWGPRDRIAYKNPLLKTVHIGDGMTPAIGQDAIDIINSQTSPEVIRKNIASAINDPTHVLNTQPRFKGMADTLGSILKDTDGKRTVVVSGSGRGDYVHTRARLLADQIRKNKLQDQIRVIALLANSETANPELKPFLQGYDDVVTPVRGWVPKDLFVGLQGMADVHMGSSGTSSLAESLASRNILSLPGSWGYYDEDQKSRPDNVKIKPNSFADEQNKLLRSLNTNYDKKLEKKYPTEGVTPDKAGHNAYWRKYKTHANLDDWNMGNMDHASGRGGVLITDSVSDVIDLLRDPDRLAKLKAEADTRGADELRKIVDGRNNMTDFILNKVRSNVSKARWRAGGKLGLSAGALLGGAAMLPFGMSPKSQDSWYKGILPKFDKSTVPSFLDKLRSTFPLE